MGPKRYSASAPTSGPNYFNNRRAQVLRTTYAVSEYSLRVRFGEGSKQLCCHRYFAATCAPGCIRVQSSKQKFVQRKPVVRSTVVSQKPRAGHFFPIFFDFFLIIRSELPNRVVQRTKFNFHQLLPTLGRPVGQVFDENQKRARRYLEVPRGSQYNYTS